MIMNIVILLMIIIKKLSETTLHDHDHIVDDDDDGLDEEVDRISELPEHIIHHIMEFLPIETKDTTRISVVSKKFFSCWCSFPAMDFNFLPEDLTTLVINRSTESVLKCVQYCVNQRRLNSNTYPLKRLTFCAPVHGGWEPEMDGDTIVVDLINFAIRNQVKELALLAVDYTIQSNSWVKLSCLPEPVFSAKSITILRLHGFKLVEANSDHHQHVTFDFPLIEVFDLGNCCGITSIVLRGAKQLKEVELWYCSELDKVHIDGPTTLELLNYGGEHYCEIDITSSCKRVEVFQLSDTDITDDKWIKSSFFGIVQQLRFDSCSLPFKTRWFLKSLKALKLVGSDCKVEFDTPFLECFHYHIGSLEWAQIPLVVFPHGFEAKLDCTYLIKAFSQSIHRFTNCRILTLVCHSTEELTFSRAVREVLIKHPPLHGIKHLKIELSKLHDMVKLIDSLLWYAPHPNTISIINVNHPGGVKTIKKFENVEERTRLQAYFSATYMISPVSED
ncbi:hypothetical protein FNV43_RR09024 [Rhamnella rubrinervis]|uniref:F-box domain-containing protein n=1 Tax=Rhamnella rubrinervis TaxID=2594499 RepID=A0A8K0MJG3_9ROSA|nr:hypothetical protein FNV43_RR09024 [Rhamnella rubrinervis]